MKAAGISVCPHCGASCIFTDSDDAPVSSDSIAAEVLSSQQVAATAEDDAVLTALRRLDESPSWVGAILLLAISLFLFVGTSLNGDTWKGLLILVGVILFHECGHYVAMRYFGYRNLRMFFIPFFGAAVSGRHYNVTGWQKTIVALAGPVPGILLGTPLGVLGLALREPNLIQISLVFLCLNGFNLLPFLPLDGGWVVHSVLFVRHPYMDGIFRIVAALGLLGIAILMNAWLLIGLALLMLVAVPTAWRLASVAYRLRQAGVSMVSADAESIPTPTALAILDAIRPIFARESPPKLLAQNVANVFSALNAAAPGPLASFAILALHLGSFLIALVMGVALMLLREPLP